MAVGLVIGSAVLPEKQPSLTLKGRIFDPSKNVGQLKGEKSVLEQVKIQGQSYSLKSIIISLLSFETLYVRTDFPQGGIPVSLTLLLFGQYSTEPSVCSRIQTGP